MGGCRPSPMASHPRYEGRSRIPFGSSGIAHVAASGGGCRRVWGPWRPWPPQIESRRRHGAANFRLAPARSAAGKHTDAGHELGVLGGLSALSLDALSSVAYGPEAMVARARRRPAHGAALHGAADPRDHGHAHAAGHLLHAGDRGAPGGRGRVRGRQEQPRPLPAACSPRRRSWSTTCSPSRSASPPGRRASAACSPSLAHHLLLVSLVGLAILTAVNLFGIAESARLLMLPTAIFVLSILAVIVAGAVHAASGRADRHLPRPDQAVDRARRRADPEGVRSRLLGGHGRGGDLQRRARVQAPAGEDRPAHRDSAGRAARRSCSSASAS